MLQLLLMWDLLMKTIVFLCARSKKSMFLKLYIVTFMDKNKYIVISSCCVGYASFFGNL
jgi:hypothetical protein